ncbi:MAG: hypothetical protein ACUVX8_19060 [Candidatus Zipacnadales bacterium]
MMIRITVGVIGALFVVLSVCLFVLRQPPAISAACLGTGLLLLYRSGTAKRSQISDISP